MRSLVVLKFTKAANYTVVKFPTPSIQSSDDVLIKVHAAGANNHDVMVASGKTKILEKHTFPLKLGEDVSGTVVQVGSEVTNVHVGDNVYTRLSPANPG